MSDLPDAQHLADAAVADQLGRWPDAPLPPSAATTAADAGPQQIWLQRLEVAGFRGAGPPLVCELPPGPGLTVIAARNGTGKSTLSDGLEVLLTGQAARWHGRDSAARAGWRNLHQTSPRVAATFLVDGREVEAAVTWSTDKVDSAVTEVSEPGALPLGELALQASPVLACGELGERLRGSPAKVYDTVASVLGLGPLREGRERLARLRRGLVERRRAHQAAGDALRAEVAACAFAPPEIVAALTQGSGLSEALARDAEVRRAQQQGPAAWQLPEARELLDLATGLEQALLATHDLDRQAADRTTARASLLLAALPVVSGSTCPLCGTHDALPAGWAEGARAEVTALQALAQRVQRARQRATEAERALMAAVEALPQAEALPAAWREVPTNSRARVEHVRRWWPEVHATLSTLRAEALDGQRAQEQAWAPLAHQLSMWANATAAIAANEAVIERIASAEAVLHQRVDAARAERFAPLQARALSLWSRLRQSSSVALDDVKLAGRRTRRKLDLLASIEGHEAPAQGVMSQGELNALALALFLPRALLDSQPFRFVVIDDPVQAMDPSKVAGLAEVLHEVAHSRQVVVLTHDERLLQALRWQRVPHRTLRLQRDTESTLSLHAADDSVSQLLGEAHVVLSSRVDAEVKARAVPGLCRLALEQALRERLGSRWVAAGVPLSEVHERLAEHVGARSLMAWWWFDDPGAIDGLADALGGTMPDGVALYHALQSGSHGRTLRVGKLPGRTRALIDALGAS